MIWMPDVPADHDRTIGVVNNVAPSDLSKFNNVVFERIQTAEEWKVRDLVI